MISILFLFIRCQNEVLFSVNLANIPLTDPDKKNSPKHGKKVFKCTNFKSCVLKIARTRAQFGFFTVCFKNPNVSSPHVRESGFRNPGNFYIQNPESWKFLLVESGILGLGIRNTAVRIRNPTNNWNPESKFHCIRSGIQ